MGKPAKDSGDAARTGAEARYTPRPYTKHTAVEPIDELLETRVMTRIMDEVVHGVPADCVAAKSDEERAFARRVRADVERTLGEEPDEGCTSYVEWELGPDFGLGPDSDGGQVLV